VFLNVIIPAYRATATIGDTLKSVLANRETFSGDFDITVVDSTEPSPDEKNSTAEIVASLDPAINYIHLSEKAYPGRARNEGVRNTRGDVLCFIDADARADVKWLKSIHDFLDNNPDVAAVGGAVLNGNPNDGYSRLAHWCEFSGYGSGSPEGVRRVQPTVNVAIRRETFEKFGPFLEDQFGNEDVLLFSRMKNAGARLHFSRKPVVYHINKTKPEDIYTHQYRLGESTGRARVMYDLPGSFLARLGGSYLIPFIKTHFIGWRILTEEPREYFSFLVLWPRVFAAMLHFARGFRKGVSDTAGEKK